MILLSAAAMGLLTVFAPGPFSPGGSALAQELPTDDPPVNFRVIFYNHSFVSLVWGIPLDRGITRHVLQRYEHNGNEFISSGTDHRIESPDGDIEGLSATYGDAEVEPNTLYRYDLTFTNSSDTVIIETSVTVRTAPEPGDVSKDATLSDLTLSGVDMDPSDRTFIADLFISYVISYVGSAANDVTETTVTPTVNRSGASYVIKLDGVADADGVIPLAVGSNTITIEVTSADNSTSRTYTVIVTRASTDESGSESSGRSGPSSAPLKARFRDVPAGHDGSTAFTLQIAFNEPIKTTEAALQALTVTGGTVTSAQEVGGLSDRWEITVTPNGNDDVRISLPPITSCDDEGAICTYDGKVLQRGVAVSVPRAPLSARFENVPAGHDGSTAFALQLAFSEPIETTETAIQQALMVTEGTVASVRQVDGRSDLWEITAMPNSDDDVSVSLPLTTSCNADNAICTAEGRMLLQGVAVSVPRTPLSVRFENVPAGHDGSTAFALQLVFSEPIETTAPALTQALTVTGGRTIGSQRVKGRSDLWEITAVSNSNNDVSIALSSTTSCDADGAVCTKDGLALQNDAQAAIPFVGYVMPHSLAKVSGDDQEGSASTQLAEPFVVLALDEDGAAMAEVLVTFTVTAGGGMLSTTTDTNPCAIKLSKSSITAITDANGQATTTLTLGRDPGTNTVEATVEGLEAETFTATATEQAMPHRLAKVCGEDQEGTAGEQLAEPFVVLVSNEDGAAIAGVAVSFAVTAGGGMLSATTATTDANGRVRTWLTLGSELGTNTVSATVEGLESVTFTATGQKSPLASMFDDFLSGSGKLVALPDSPQLAQNAPNPFNSQTVLSYFLPAAGPVRLDVFTLTGQRVAVLHQGPQQAGYHRLRWNGRDDAGHPVASGIYLYRLVTTESVLTRKLTLLR